MGGTHPVLPMMTPMASLRRRRLITIGGAALAATAAGGGYVAYVATRPPVFRHGVASADPTARSVLLWTRVTVAEETSVDVEWAIATDADISNIVAKGEVTTTAEQDFTVRVDVPNLTPGTTYHYRFRAEGQKSKVGRTKTLPEGSISQLKIAFVSCSSYAHGAFHPYAKIAEDPTIDLVVHLGDYIYEFASGQYGNWRRYEPKHACVSLDDYRLRHRQYKTDKSLAEAHRLFPWVVLWDDHDFANNAFLDGAEGHQQEVHGDWVERREAARRAFLEWVPVRTEGTGPISRSFKLGDLADLIVADSRMGEKTEPSRRKARETMLGQPQEEWLSNTLRESQSTFCILAQQLIVASFKVTGRFYDQSWQAYPRSRTRLVNQIQRFAAGRTLAVSGDLHTSVASVIHTSAQEPTNTPPVMVEFVTPSVTSPCPFEDIPDEQNKHLAYLNTKQRGFLLMELSHEQAIATFHQVDPPQAKDLPPTWSIGKRFSVKPGVIALDDITPDEVSEGSASPADDVAPPDITPDEAGESEEVEPSEVTPG